VLGWSAEDVHRAVVRLLQPEQHVDRGRLAGAVGAEQRDQLSDLNMGVDVANSFDWPTGRPVRLPQPPERDPVAVAPARLHVRHASWILCCGEVKSST
jgi:hypothetical protein